MESKKVMVFKDPYKEKGLTYQYCERGSAPDELLKEEITSIFNDIVYKTLVRWCRDAYFGARCIGYNRP